MKKYYIIFTNIDGQVNNVNSGNTFAVLGKTHSRLNKPLFKVFTEIDSVLITYLIALVNFVLLHHMVHETTL